MNSGTKNKKSENTSEFKRIQENSTEFNDALVGVSPVSIILNFRQFLSISLQCHSTVTHNITPENVYSLEIVYK